MNTPPLKRRLGRTAIYSYILIVVTGLGICGYQLRTMLISDPPLPVAPIAIIQKVRNASPLTISSRPWSTPFVQARQRDKAKSLMAAGEYESALEAAKSFYNVAELSKTSDAIKLVSAVLGRARGKATADVFRREQGVST